MTLALDLPARRAPVRPFDTLDADWAALCRRHRRPGAIAHWAQQEPVLAGCRRLSDVIPPRGVDRNPYCRALARLSVAGDELATRALLQLLVPGLLRLAARWRALGSLADPDGEVISRAAVYLSRLGEADIACNPAGWLLWSVHRDLLYEFRRSSARHEVRVANPDDRRVPGRGRTTPTAEQTAFTGPLLWDALVDARPPRCAARAGRPGRVAARGRPPDPDARPGQRRLGHSGLPAPRPRPRPPARPVRRGQLSQPTDRSTDRSVRRPTPLGRRRGCGDGRSGMSPSLASRT